MSERQVASCAVVGGAAPERRAALKTTGSVDRQPLSPRDSDALQRCLRATTAYDEHRGANGRAAHRTRSDVPLVLSVVLDQRGAYLQVGSPSPAEDRTGFVVFTPMAHWNVPSCVCVFVAIH